MAEKAIADVGLIGLAVMGENLALNIARRGIPISVFNRTVDKVTEFAERRVRGEPVFGATSVEQFVKSLAKPRRVLLMVKAGAPVDDTIATLIPHLEPGDLIVDGGNSHPRDTERRALEIAAHGLQFVGMGVSGGEEGALKGPSLMPGGPADAYALLAPILKKIAAQVDDGPCVTHIGPGASGHFVKMVHNGIEYGMMQAYAEGLSIMAAKTEFNLPLAEVADAWGFGTVIRSWLLELTADVLKDKDSFGRIEPRVADSGEGRWTAQEAIDLGVPAPVISTALMARFASQGRDEFASRLLALLRNRFGGHSVVPKEPA